MVVQQFSLQTVFDVHGVRWLHLLDWLSDWAWKWRLAYQS